MPVLGLQDKPLVDERRPMDGPGTEAPAEPTDFELVLGRKQIAAFLLLVLGLISVSSTAAYVAGKTAGKAITGRTQPISGDVPHLQAPAPAAMATREPVVGPKTASVSSPKLTGPKLSAPKSSAPAPILIEPGPGQMYLQVAAVEKVLALKNATSLRSQSLAASIAPAPDGKRFRVLIGPYADQAALQHGKAQADRLGLRTILRKY